MEFRLRIWKLDTSVAICGYAWDRPVRILVSAIMAFRGNSIGFQWYEKINGVRVAEIYLGRWYWEKKKQVVLV